MKVFAHYDQFGNIHAMFSVEAREGASAMIVPPRGQFVAEVETKGLGLKGDDSDAKKLAQIAKDYIVPTPFPVLTLSKREKKSKK